MGGRVLSTGLELAGFACIVAGVALWSVPAALVVAGVLLFVLALALDGRIGRRS